MTLTFSLFVLPTLVRLGRATTTDAVRHQ